MYKAMKVTAAHLVPGIWNGMVSVKRLTEIGYDGAVVIETFGQPSKELARAACIWRPLANSADELATEGLAFYKKMFS
jgi:D-psicose/D-tagatose/L-ribulose 3-epimerase